MEAPALIVRPWDVADEEGGVKIQNISKSSPTNKKRKSKSESESSFLVSHMFA